MYDSVAVLLTDGVRSYDSYGNESISRTRRTVYVLPRSVYHTEFYQAAQAGLHPSITLTLTNRADYSGEKLVEFEGKVYDIVRVDWKAQRDAVSLICEEKTGGEYPPSYTPAPTPPPTPDGEEGDGNG